MFTISMLNGALDTDISTKVEKLYKLITTPTFNDTDTNDTDTNDTDTIETLTNDITAYVNGMNKTEYKVENSRLKLYSNTDTFVNECAHSTVIETVFKVITDNDDTDKNGVQIIQKRINTPFKAFDTENAVEFSNAFSWLYSAFKKSVTNGQTISRSALKKSILPYIDCTVTIDTLSNGFAWLFSKATAATIGKKYITVKISETAFCNGVLNSIRAVNSGLTTTFKSVDIDK